MDPNACLTLLCDALRDGDRDAAIEALDNLREWLARGGFLPNDPREEPYVDGC